MKTWAKPELTELSVQKTLVGTVLELAESEPSGFTDSQTLQPLLGDS